MALQSQTQYPAFTQPAVYPARKDLPPPPCNTCSDCPICMTLKELFDRERALQQHLDGFHRQTNQDRVSLANYGRLCKDLRLSLADLQHECQSLKIALEKGRRAECAILDDLKVEKEKTSIAHKRCTSLHAENATLWKFIEEVEVVPANPNKSPPTFRDLYFTNMELRKRLSELQENESTVIYDGDDDDDDDDDDGTEIMEEDEQASIQLLS
ncbi:hypothetical protein EMCG_07090 [[Emmonsia] crescens]|uniref:Uncharacterized protein n=1 Tax=[Emmonsia] crescens TaxID=73230 RepID=A0A0G2J615_9EURO|nr:hypothetical protein EMCG_07090 [Emmonsia crescens UAMH 3008]